MSRVPFRFQPHCVTRWLLCAALALASAPLFAAAPTEYQIKAVFLLNFARYTSWPDEALPAEAPIEVCVFGRDPFGGHLIALESRQAQGRAVKVRHPASVDRLPGCAVVFIAASEQRHLNTILQALAHTPTLTVSDIEGFVEAGGAIGLVTEDDRIRFDINRATLARDGLKLSAQLLKLARRLVGRSEE